MSEEKAERTATELMVAKLPQAFKEETQAILHDEYAAFLQALTSETPVAIHMNNKLELPYLNNRVSWCNAGYYLTERPQFTLDPLWHSGAYYVQEASSMFLSHAIKQHIPTKALVLDMCAAPGGKSILLSEHLSEGFLVSNEYIRNRSRILAENIAKWGNANCMVTSNAPLAFESLPHLFDAILVDAPCSGEGMFRKDENAISEWSPANVANCVARQQEILESAWEALTPGGVLIYSTCTYNRSENEQMVQWIMDEYRAEYLPVEIPTQWNILETQRGYRFMPHRTQGEGLFMALLRKPDDSRRTPRSKSQKVTVVKEKSLQQLLKNPEKHTLFAHQEVIYALPTERMALYQLLNEKLYLVLPGIAVARQKGKDYIPETALALSKAFLAEGNFPSIELTREQALAFLANQPLPPLHSSNGYLLMKYMNTPLGFVKQVGNRCNNLYPDAWRIRMNIPSELPKTFYSK